MLKQKNAQYINNQFHEQLQSQHQCFNCASDILFQDFVSGYFRIQGFSSQTLLFSYFIFYIKLTTVTSLFFFILFTYVFVPRNILLPCLFLSLDSCNYSLCILVFFVELYVHLWGMSYGFHSWQIFHLWRY